MERARRLSEEDLTDFMIIHGEQIMAEAGRQRDEDGNWSEDDLTFLEMVARKRLEHPAIN